MTNEDNEKIVEGLLSVSPPVIVSTTTLLGLPLTDWVYISTIIYTIVGIVTIIKKHWIDPWRSKKKALLRIQQRLEVEKYVDKQYRDQQRRTTGGDS